uniref:Uncharacterized protein n=1 Tax=Chromera velia CCMP2878 TaxID=1169474 RepID=A0A0G4GRV1_9ALVE|eukprot:Cvel_23120.t1-p1 / transcript=Cvel_23120.t1 / gene=Cvel_23120 / organism=Chromera_velia_CCMP2878 / gene_product=hypothetical protein / transcript_product=hypothetical protein / location=Cvel_scaffold2348:14754-18715(+) / protein_length=309 / sequence_SO=supercontig / SO=protein_coding / is_pseudo=false
MADMSNVGHQPLAGDVRREKLQEYKESVGWFRTMARLESLQRRIDAIKVADKHGVPESLYKVKPEEIRARQERRRKLQEMARTEQSQRVADLRDDMEKMHETQEAREIEEIKSLPNDIISSRVQNSLIKLKKNLRRRRLNMDIAKKVQDEWKLENIMKEVQQARAEEARKRHRETGVLLSEKTASFSAALAAGTAPSPPKPNKNGGGGNAAAAGAQGGGGKGTGGGQGAKAESNSVTVSQSSIPPAPPGPVRSLSPPHIPSDGQIPPLPHLNPLQSAGSSQVTAKDPLSPLPNDQAGPSFTQTPDIDTT